MYKRKSKDDAEKLVRGLIRSGDLQAFSTELISRTAHYARHSKTNREIFTEEINRSLQKYIPGKMHVHTAVLRRAA